MMSVGGCVSYLCFQSMFGVSGLVQVIFFGVLSCLCVCVPYK